MIRLGDPITYRPAEKGETPGACHLCNWTAGEHTHVQVDQLTGEIGDYICPVCAATTNIRMDTSSNLLMAVYLPEFTQIETTQIQIVSAYLQSIAKAIDEQAKHQTISKEKIEFAEHLKLVTNGINPIFSQRQSLLVQLIQTNPQVKSRLASDAKIDQYEIAPADVTSILKTPTWIVDALILAGKNGISEDQLGGLRIAIQTRGMLTTQNVQGAANHPLVDVVSSGASNPTSYEASIRFLDREIELCTQLMERIKAA